MFTKVIRELWPLIMAQHSTQLLASLGNTLGSQDMARSVQAKAILIRNVRETAAPVVGSTHIPLHIETPSQHLSALIKIVFSINS